MTIVLPLELIERDSLRFLFFFHVLGQVSDHVIPKYFRLHNAKVNNINFINIGLYNPKYEFIFLDHIICNTNLYYES